MATDALHSFRSTALGSALLAGATLGLFGWDLEKPETLKAVNTAGVDNFEPSVSEEDRERRYHGWERAVKRAMKWDEEALISSSDDE